MTRVIWPSLFIVVLGLSTSSRVSAADPVPSSPENISASAPSAADDEAAPTRELEPDTDENAELPPGHPQLDSMAEGDNTASDAQDSAAPGTKLSRDSISRSPTVPAGNIEVHVLSAENQPLAGAALILQVHHESISEGNSDTERNSVTNAGGVARFEHLSTDSASSYRVLLNNGGVKYGMQPFQLTAQAGVSLTLHQYPLVRNLRQAMVAMECLVFVEPRDDVFQFEIVYQLFNVGRTIWVPEDLDVRLPSDRQAFTAQQSLDDLRVEASDVGVRLVGAVPPGQHQVSYTFHVPRHNTSEASFDFEMPPNVLTAKVGLASSRSAELIVEGFADAQPTTAQNGQRLLLTSKTFDGANQLPGELRFEVRGLPTLGIGRIVAAIVAGLLALSGLVFAMARRKRGRPTDEDKALHDRARERLLSELSELEGAKLTGRIGPRTYEETRSTLMEALIRLEPLPE